MDLAFFIFNRPSKTETVLNAIRSQSVKPSKITVFSDGPGNYETSGPVQQSRDIIKSATDLNIELIQRPHNYGCARNITEGLRYMMNTTSRFLVLEDDTYPATKWLESMTLLLDKYEHDPKVYSVGGFPSINNGALSNKLDVVFIPRFTCWGWGTWSAKYREVDLQFTSGRSWDHTSLTHVAGHDLPAVIAHAPPGTLWDAYIAGYYVFRGYYHAVTRNYLINNIGLEKSSPRQVEHTIHHNIIDDRLPVTFPERCSGDLNDESNAIREYVSIMA